MGDPKVPPIGPRIRAERERRNVTIRALARVIGGIAQPHLPDRNREEPAFGEFFVLDHLCARTVAGGPVRRAMPTNRRRSACRPAERVFATSAPIGPKRLGHMYLRMTGSC